MRLRFQHAAPAGCHLGGVVTSVTICVRQPCTALPGTSMIVPVDAGSVELISRCG